MLIKASQQYREDKISMCVERKASSLDKTRNIPNLKHHESSIPKHHYNIALSITSTTPLSIPKHYYNIATPLSIATTALSITSTTALSITNTPTHH